MKGQKIYLLLGSNIGDKNLNLQKARNLIEQRIAPITAISSIYQTEAWGVSNQDDYLNQALELIVNIQPKELLHQILKIEEDLGRVRKKKYEARIIDIDIMLWEQTILKEKDLEIPHPRMHLRNFALMPIMELNSNMIHPIFKKSMKELFEQCPDDSKLNKLENE